MADAAVTEGLESQSEGSPLRRIVIVVTIYVVVGWAVLGVAEWAGRMLVLPQLFDTLLLGGMVVGLPVAGLLAWKYPELGHGDGVAPGVNPEGHTTES